MKTFIELPWDSSIPHLTFWQYPSMKSPIFLNGSAVSNPFFSLASVILPCLTHYTSPLKSPLQQLQMIPCPSSTPWVALNSRYRFPFQQTQNMHGKLVFLPQQIIFLPTSVVPVSLQIQHLALWLMSSPPSQWCLIPLHCSSSLPLFYRSSSWPDGGPFVLSLGPSGILIYASVKPFPFIPHKTPFLRRHFWNHTNLSMTWSALLVPLSNWQFLTFLPPPCPV